MVQPIHINYSQTKMKSLYKKKPNTNNSGLINNQPTNSGLVDKKKPNISQKLNKTDISKGYITGSDKTKELDRTTEISIGELNRNKLVDEITSKELSKPKELDWEKVAFLFHNTYEGLAPKFGYETRKDTKAFDTKSQNGQLMIATCKAVVSHFLTQQRTELNREWNSKLLLSQREMINSFKNKVIEELLKDVKKHQDTADSVEMLEFLKQVSYWLKLKQIEI